MRRRARTQHANHIQRATTHTRSRKVRSRAGAIAFVTLPPAPTVLPRSFSLELGNARLLQPRKELERMEPRASRPEAPAASLSSSGEADGSAVAASENSAGRDHDCERLPSKRRERRRPWSNPRLTPRPINFSCTADRLRTRSYSRCSSWLPAALLSSSPPPAGRMRGIGVLEARDRPKCALAAPLSLALPWAPNGISSHSAPTEAYTQARRRLLHAYRWRAG